MRTVLTLFAILLVTAACGGGGTADVPTPEIPGWLRLLALEGEDAPDGGGEFMAFPTQTKMDNATGGWSVYVAETTLLGEVIYAYTPDRATHLVLAEGDAAPDLASGEIDEVKEVWVNENGHVVALVSIENGSADVDWGLVSAEVDEAGVSALTGLVYDERSMGDMGLGGDLVEIALPYLHLRSNDVVYFLGITDGGESGLFRIETDGTGMDGAVVSGDALPGGRTVAAVYANGVDASGTGFAFVAEHADLSGSKGIYAGTAGNTTYGSVAVEGDALLGTDVLEDIPEDQPLIVYQGTGGVTVMYKAVSDTTKDHLIFGIPNDTDQLVVREGDADTQVTGGVFGQVDWMHNGPSANAVFRAHMSGAQGITFALFGFKSSGQFQRLILGYNGSFIPGDSSQRMGTTWPGLMSEGQFDVATNGDAGYANVLEPSLDTALFWPDRSQSLNFLVARTGDTIPGGGDVFGEGTAWRQTMADGSLLFRAPVEGAGSGIFRQGP